MGRRDEPGIALPASTAASDEHLVAVHEHLADALSRIHVTDDGARRNRENCVRARSTGLVGAGPVISVLRLPPIAIRVVEQRAQVAVGTDTHVTAAATIAAIGATHRGELLPAKGDDPRTTVSCFDPADDPIDEHGRGWRAESRGCSVLGAGCWVLGPSTEHLAPSTSNAPPEQSRTGQGC